MCPSGLRAVQSLSKDLREQCPPPVVAAARCCDWAGLSSILFNFQPTIVSVAIMADKITAKGTCSVAHGYHQQCTNLQDFFIIRKYPAMSS
jgi:hypothetical protein